MHSSSTFKIKCVFFKPSRARIFSLFFPLSSASTIHKCNVQVPEIFLFLAVPACSAPRRNGACGYTSTLSSAETSQNCCTPSSARRTSTARREGLGGQEGEELLRAKAVMTLAWTDRWFQGTITLPSEYTCVQNPLRV